MCWASRFWLRIRSPKYKFCSTVATEQNVTNVVSDDEIVIPKRIERGPTDILKALASTVQRDYTAPHYKYHDDPFLIPASNPAKRTYALAKEAGKKAARYFLENYPENFIQNPAEPNVEAFVTPEKITEDTDATEEMLIKCISKFEVNNSITAYNILERKGIELHQNTLQLLLELLCFCNQKEPVRDEYIEERWYRQRNLRDSLRLWKENSLADKIFDKMKEKDSRAYCVMIQGLAKYFQSNKAYSLYQEMQSKGLSANVEMYNSLISVSSFMKESAENRWALVQELLYNMEKEGLLPNIKTMNEVLDVISRFGRSKYARDLSLQVLAEMRYLNIEPSLGTWNYLLLIFCRENSPVSPILYDIMKEIEGKSFEIRHHKDVFFFVTAMDVCCNHIVDMSMGYKVHELLKLGNNYALIGDSYKESVYYQMFFKLLCDMENIDVIFEFYNQYVPSVYTPEPVVMLKIIDAVNLNGALHYLPQLWSDVVMFNQMERETILEKVLSVMACGKETEKLQEQFLNIAWDIKNRIDSQDKTKLYRQIQWTAQMVEDVIEICLNTNDINKAWEMIIKLIKQEGEVVGILSMKCLKRFCTTCLEVKDVEKAVACLNYCLGIGYQDIVTFVKENIDKYELTEKERKSIESLETKSPLNIDMSNNDSNHDISKA